MKFYNGDEVEVNWAGDIYRGTVSGFYEDGKPRVVSSTGRTITFSDYVYASPEKWAVTKQSPERIQVQKFFNQRSFWDRLCYLFTGKMP